MTDQSTFHIPKSGLPSFSIQGEGGTVLMRVDPDGTITFSSLIEAQEAGRIFVNTVRQYLKPMADLVAEVEALRTENTRLTQALLLSVERHIAHATGHDDDVIDYARRVIAGEEPQP